MEHDRVFGKMDHQNDQNVMIEMTTPVLPISGFKSGLLPLKNTYLGDQYHLDEVFPKNLKREFLLSDNLIIVFFFVHF